MRRTSLPFPQSALLAAALLVSIRSGLIDVVVVYRVDRLTRSLTHFAKLIELFMPRASRS